jgi:cyclophilin family peptidyl-prolyl cis-trans isomerase
MPHTTLLSCRNGSSSAGSEKATSEEFKGRLVLGLYGNAAPNLVQQFVKYANSPYGSAFPSYAYSVFNKCYPGEMVEGGIIKDIKRIEIAGSTQFEYDSSILPGEWLVPYASPRLGSGLIICLLPTPPPPTPAVINPDELDNTLSHDKRGLLTKGSLQDSRDPTFGITLGRAPQLDGFRVVFGEVLEGESVRAPDWT